MKTFVRSLSLPAGFLVAWLNMVSLLPTPAFAQVNHAFFISSYTNAQTCLNCHGPGSMNGDEGAEIMATRHWTWEYTVPGTGQQLGKKHVINNYCIAVPSNEPRCTSCHIGVGWRDDSFDFNDPTKIDCLVCHDTTGTYKKTPTGAGVPDPSVDLLAVAQSVGKTTRATCGTCHFYGGGGDAVKHGDLDSTMTNPTRELDVHMGVDGANKSCSFCHSRDTESPTGQTLSHTILGSRYSSDPADLTSCSDCHGSAPHDTMSPNGERLNTHAARVACQSCHIPTFARGGKATKMFWDWTTAGTKNPDGSDLVIKDEAGNPIYDTKKGSFRWEANVVPEYVWFNDQVTFVSLDDTVSSNSLVTINQLHGDIDDPESKIVPVKRFTGIQPYDAGNNTLAVPHLFPSSPTDTDALWKSYDWDRSLAAGMTAVGRTYSGQLGYAETEMFWVQNHMVAPKEMALACVDCHSPRGRLNFAALGYPADQAPLLQTMFGFEVGQVNVAPQPPSTEVTLSWTGTPGHSYQVQYSTNLKDWADAANGSFSVAADDPITELSWTSSEGVTARYYKIVRDTLP